MFRLIFVGVSTAAMLCVLSGTLPAQTGTSISGTVTDRQGGVVQGVAVTLTNQSAGLTRTAATDNSGVYSFLQLVPGRYSLEAELQGYKTIVVEDLELLINTSARMNLRFTETGSAGEIVRIKGAATLNAQDATVGHAFNDVQVKELPMEGRNVAGLFSLQPGVTYIGANSTDARNGAVNGGKGDQANVTLDGADVNDQQNGYAFTSVLRVTLDSVQEFRVTTTGMNADQGRSSGAQISLVTRSGTNKYRGSLYEYHRNTITSANDFFLKTSQLSQGQPNEAPKLLRNIFGGSIGGPVVKDRLFLFFNYEGRRDASATTVNRSVPSMDMRNGIVHYQTLSGGTAVLTPDDIRKIDPLHIGPSPATLAYMQQYPAPNNTSAGDGLNVVGYRFAAPIHLKNDTYIARVDYRLTRDGRHVMFWRGNLQNDHSTEAQQFPGHPPNFVDLNNTKGFAASYKALFTDKLVNSLTWGYTRSAAEQDAAMNSRYVSLRTLAALNVNGYSNGRTIPVHNVTDDLSWQKGAHALQFGATLRWIRNGSFTYSGSFPGASTTNSWLAGTGRELQATLPDLLPSYSIPYIQTMANVLGLVTQGSAKYLYDRTGALLPVGTPKFRNYAADEYQAYAQDAWRVRQNLTLTFGLRWGIYSPPWETNGLQVAPTPSLSDWFNLRGTNMLKGIPSNQAPKIQVDLAGAANGKLGYYPWQTISPAPRVAFAWSPVSQSGLLKRLTGGPGHFVVRGGFGMAYDRIGGGLATTFDAAGSFGLSASISNPAHSVDVSTAPRYTGEFNVPAALLPPGPQGGFPATPPSAQAISFGMDDHITLPYQYLLNFTVQRQLPHGFSIEAAYIGRMAHHLLVQGDLAMTENLKDPASGIDYFTAAGILARAALANTPVSQVGKVPYWENLYPAIAGGGLTATQAVYSKIKANSPSWLDGLWDLDVTCQGNNCSRFGPFAFFNDQYSSLAGWRSLGWSDYQAGQLLVRKRFSAGMQFDFNYTFGKSFDISSAVERAGAFPSAFLHNGWDPNANKSVSDFDTRHSINANFIAELPFGKNRLLLSHAGRVADGILGGWQVSSIFRWTSGFPAAVGEGNYYPTNWETTGWATRIGDSPQTRTSKNAHNSSGTSGPNLFADASAAIKAYQFTLPGYVGTRNDLRGDGFFGIDMGVSKSWKMPYAEGHRVQFRWEAFNITNTVRFDVSSLNMNLANPGIFGQYSAMLNSPRVMQFSLRYEF